MTSDHEYDHADIDRMLATWVHKSPDGKTAIYNDPQFGIHIEHWRRMLHVVEEVLRDDNIIPRVRMRVIKHLIYAAPSEAEALERIRQQKAMIDKLASMPAVWRIQD